MVLCLRASWPPGYGPERAQEEVAAAKRRLRDFWSEEFERAPGVPVVLAETQHVGASGADCAASIPVQEGRRLAREMGCVCYVPCSASGDSPAVELTDRLDPEVLAVFAAAADAVVHGPRIAQPKKCLVM